MRKYIIIIIEKNGVTEIIYNKNIVNNKLLLDGQFFFHHKSKEQ